MVWWLTQLGPTSHGKVLSSCTGVSLDTPGAYRWVSIIWVGCEAGSQELHEHPIGDICLSLFHRINFFLNMQNS